MSPVRGECIPAAARSARNTPVLAEDRSSISPTTSMSRPAVWFTTTPGSASTLDEYTTAPITRSGAIARASAPPGSRRDRSGAGGRAADRPIEYHQGIPFCTNTNAVSGPHNACASGAIAASAVALVVTKTTSWTPSSEGRSLARTRPAMVRASACAPSRSATPFARIAARLAPRAITETACPAAANFAAR